MALTTMATTELHNMVAIIPNISWQRHAALVNYCLLLWYWTSMLWSIDTCQNQVSTEYHVSILQAQVCSWLRSHVLFTFFQLTADQVLVFHCITGSSLANSVECLWQATVRFRQIFFFFVHAKRQMWLTSNYILRKILRFSQAVACADCVVLEATCTSSGNKQKVRHFRKDRVSTSCVELNCENCKEFADHPFRVTHRANELTVYSDCQTKQRVLQPNLRVHSIDLRP